MDRIRAYDFLLVILTVALLVIVGVICFYGTAYSFFISQADKEWASTGAYSSYLQNMNLAVSPFAMGLTVVLALCIPKRIMRRTALTVVSVILLLLSIFVSVSIGIAAGLSFMIVFASLVQLYVIWSILAGSKSLVFEKKSLVGKLGSALLHLGILIFLLDLIALQESPYHLTIFWFVLAMITAGMIFCFYPGAFQNNSQI